MALVAEPLCSLVVVWYFKEKAVYSLTRASRIAPDRCWELNEGWIDDWGGGRFSCMSNLPMWMVLYLISKNVLRTFYSPWWYFSSTTEELCETYSLWTTFQNILWKPLMHSICQKVTSLLLHILPMSAFAGCILMQRMDLGLTLENNQLIDFFKSQSINVPWSPPT